MTSEVLCVHMMDVCMDDGWMCGWMDGCVDVWMDGCVDVWMCGWMDVWMNGPCFY